MTIGQRKAGCAVAQSRNEDRIKIFIRSVDIPATHTKNITSESALHRISPRNSYRSPQLNLFRSASKNPHILCESVSRIGVKSD
jgi:hypothetical protein